MQDIEHPQYIPHNKLHYDILLFNQYIEKSRYYFEYGTPDSIYKVKDKNNIINIVSVHTDFHHVNRLITSGLFNKVDFIVVEEDSNDYIKAFINLKEDLRKRMDTIFLGGKYRVAILLTIFNFIDNNIKIIVDQFINKTHNNILLYYYEIIDEAGTTVILKKKNVSSPHPEVIKFYETDSR